MVKFALYQMDRNALEAYEKAFESADGDRIANALAAVRDEGLLSSSDADWVNSYTRFAAEFDREKINGENRIAVSLSDGERYDYEDAITWAESNLAYVVSGSYEIENVPLPITNSYNDYVLANFPKPEMLDSTD